MRDSIKVIFQDKGIKYALFLSFIVLVLQTIALFFARLKLPPVIPLFNSLAWGRDRLVPVDMIFVVPLFLLVLSVGNGIAAGMAYKKHALVSRMLIVNLMLAVLLSSVALVQIFLLVF